MPSLSAIVPATNAPPTLGACLDAIRSADEPPEEVIVVEEGGGPADARNRGAARATGTVLVFVDADVVVHRDAFARIRRAFERDPELAAVFGSYDDQPGRPGHRLGVPEPPAPPRAPGGRRSRRRRSGRGSAPCGEDVFEASGGFDAERYLVPSIEDIELGTRLAAAGCRIELDPLLQGTHLKAWSLRGMVETDFWARGVPWVELLLRQRSGSSTLNLGWRHRLSALAALGAAGALLRGRLRRTLVALGVLVALNRSFYELLARRRGRAQAAIGVWLHVLHHVVGALSVPVGIVEHLRRRDG